MCTHFCRLAKNDFEGKEKKQLAQSWHLRLCEWMPVSAVLLAEALFKIYFDKRSAGSPDKVARRVRVQLLSYRSALLLQRRQASAVSQNVPVR